MPSALSFLREFDVEQHQGAGDAQLPAHLRLAFTAAAANPGEDIEQGRRLRSKAKLHGASEALRFIDEYFLK